MENVNYTKEKVTISIGWANIFGLLLLIPTGIIFGLPYHLIWTLDVQFDLPFWMELLDISWIFILYVLAGVVAHELIHGIFFARYAKNGFQSVTFGVMWKMIAPYCHCKEPLTVRQYVIGAMMPTIILGFLPAILAIIIGNAGLLAFGIFFTIAGCGDILMIYALRKEKEDTLVEDHPSEAGFYVYRTN